MKNNKPKYILLDFNEFSKNGSHLIEKVGATIFLRFFL
jgi:hypothetical protein